jgi:hypothetical protein
VKVSATPSSEAWKLMADGNRRRFDLTRSSRRRSSGNPHRTSPAPRQPFPELRKKSAGPPTWQADDPVPEPAGLLLLLPLQDLRLRVDLPALFGFPDLHNSRGKAVCHYCG